ncbi:MAG: outer membrane beta-barrel protein [Saprospiraceae bacterium]|nr:outer membrane beta-barrel protein [Saprospiraceae bacterium]
MGRNNTKGIISNVLYRDPENEALTLNTYDNIGKSKETYFRLVGAIPPGGKYFFVAGSQYNHTVYEGLYNGLPVSFSRGSWRFFTFHSLKLTKNTRIMMNGFLLVNGQQNLTALKNFGQLNFTINQTFLDNKLNITVFLRDVLRTMENKFLLDQAGIVFEGERYNDNQRVGMSVRYSFGLPSKKQNKKGMFDNMDE